MRHDRAGRRARIVLLCRQLLLALLLLLSALPARADEPSFSFGGNANWFSQSATSHDGVAAWQSGQISHSQSSWMETTVTGPGAIRFWWKVSSESCCDRLSFAVDGVIQNNIRGESGWQSQAYAVGEGSHTLRWSYATDSSVLSGANAGWVDEVSFTPGTGFDLTAPTTSVSPRTGSYPPSQTISLSCNDNVGCSGTWYCLGSGCIPSATYTLPIALSESGDLSFYSSDPAGNVEPIQTVHYTILADSTAPVTTPSRLSGTYEPFTVTLYCSDAGGLGCAGTFYCLGAACSPDTPYNSGITIANSGDLRFYSRDTVGNTEAVQTVSYLIDKTPPVTTANPPGGSYTSAPVVTLTCDDGSGTGCRQTLYCLGTNCTPNKLYSEPIRINGGTVLRYFSRDVAFNAETVVSQTYENPRLSMTITVPGTAATVQEAIDSAYIGDTVLVAPGTYRENLDFYGKAITVTSRDGAAVTVIDGGKAGPVVSFRFAEIPNAVLNGFTLRNGGNNPGISISSASPTITNNVITASAPGIAVGAGAPLIQNNVISGNQASYGGGIYAGPTASPTITGNLIADNSASYGGGLNFWNSGAATVRGNTIRNNSASDGGAIYIISSSPSLVQNLVYNNSASRGGGIYAATASGSVVNNTFAANGSSSGASIVMPGGSFFNNVVVSLPGQFPLEREGSSTFSHNVLYATPADGSVASGSQRDGNGNVTGDPRLANVKLGYLGLTAGSCAIDAGDASLAALPNTDFGGMSRIQDGNGDGSAVLDAGAFEFDPARPVALLPGAPSGFVSSSSVSLAVTGERVVSYRYALDGGAWSADIARATPLTLTNLTNGQHVLVVVGKDAQGREQRPESATAVDWVVNTEVTDLVFATGGSNPWFLQASVSRDGIAYQSGAVANSQTSWLETTVVGPGAIRFWWKVASDLYGTYLRFSLDGTDLSWIEGPSDWQNRAFVVGAGQHTLRWTAATRTYYPRVTDAAWLDQVIFQKGDGLDVTAPVTTAAPADQIFAPGPQDITLVCSDQGGSGCSDSLFCTGSGCTPTTRYLGPIGISSDTILRFSSTDQAGNQEITKERSYRFDSAPPVTQTDLPAGSYSGPRRVSLSCYDSDGLGCAGTYYCLGKGCTPDTPAGTPIEIGASGELGYYSVDRAGNRERVKYSGYTITPDLTPPVTATPDDGPYQPFWLTFSCNDGVGSGCAATYYCLGEGCSPDTLATRVDMFSSSVVRYYSVDRSGNRESVKTARYLIDKLWPSTSSNLGGGVFGTGPSVTLSCVDAGDSGCSATYYCLGKGCSPYTRYSGAIGIPSSTYLRFYSVDRAGNREALRTERYTVLTGPSRTINVPADQATIQGAIDAARDGDSILVAPGTYLENLDFMGKAVTVTGSAGAEATVLDGNQVGPVVRFASGEGQSSILQGFTVRNGKAGFSGSTWCRGGGIFISQAWPAIRDNHVVGNTACEGAGIYVEQGGPVIQGNLIAHNTQLAGSIGDGGGLSMSSTDHVRIVGNTITDNRQPGGRGGGIYAYGTTELLVSGNIITGNTDQEGESCTNGGGGLFLSGAGGVLIQNLITNNGVGCGSAVNLHSFYQSQLLNNTIIDTIRQRGSLVRLGETEMVNNLLYASNGVTPLDCSNGLQVFSHNLLFSPRSGSYAGCADQTGSDGNLSSDPGLVGAAGGYFGLRTGSPAIDAGDAQAASLPALDLDGVLRVLDGAGTGSARVDIGAFEYDPVAPRAVLAGGPPLATRASTASFTVEGEGILSYRFSLDGGSFGADIPVATPIELQGLGAGPHLVAVLGKTAATEQRLVSATVYGWNIDMLPPVTSASPGSGSFTSAQSVTLSCDDGGGSGCAGTFYCLGGGCTPDIPYTGPIAVSTTTGLRYFSRDAFGQEEAVKTASYNFTGSISGRVTESGAGTAVAGIFVAAYNAATGTMTGYTYSDAAGAYRIAGLPDGNYQLHVSGSDYVTQWYSGRGDRASADLVVLRAPGSADNVDVVMTKAGSISGRVTGADTGAGVGSIYVTAFASSSPSSAGSAITDSTGAYTIPGLAPGNYALYLESTSSGGKYLAQWYRDKPTRESADTVAVGAAAAVTGIDATLRVGGTLSGRVTASASGAAIPGAMVALANAATGQTVRYQSCDASGRYQFSGLSGSYKVGASASGYVTRWYNGKPGKSSADVITVSASGSASGIDLALSRGGSITGRVTEAGTGAPLANVYVTAFEVTGSWIGSGLTDSSGNYQISGLAAGNYQLEFGGTGFVSQWYGGASQDHAALVPVTAAAVSPGIDMTMTRAGSISGRVSDRSTGAPILANLTVYGANGGPALLMASTDSTGAYTISGLPSGSYQLQAQSAQFNSEYLPAWHGGQEQRAGATVLTLVAPAALTGVDITLGKGAALAGRVSDSVSGAPLGGAYVVAYDASGASTAAYCDPAGDYRIAGLAPGSYRLSFAAAGYVTQWYDRSYSSGLASTVSLSAQQTVTVDAALDQGGAISGTISDRVTGAGIPDCFLYLIDRVAGEYAASTRTDANGAYRIAGLPSGTYRINIEPSFNSDYLGQWYGGSPGYSCSNTVTVTSPRESTGVDAQLERGGSISGRVTDASTGAGIFGVSVTTSGSGTAGTGFASTDDSGSYTLRALSSGDYTLSFSDASHVGAELASVRVSAPAPVTGQDIALVAGATISGRVSADNGSAAYQVLVQAVDAVTGRWLGADTSDQDGSFSISGLPSGSYALYYDGHFADGTGFASGWVMAGAAEGSASLEEPGEGAGPAAWDPVTPVTAEGAATVATALFSNDPAPVGNSGPVVAIGSTPGRMPVPGAARFTVAAPGQVGGIAFPVARLGGISGLVRDSATQTPLRNIYVQAYGSGTGSFAGSAYSDYQGRYTISGLTSGSYRVQFSSGTGVPSGDPTSNWGYLGAWYGGASAATAIPVAVLAPGLTSGIDAGLEQAGGIVGTVTASVCPGPGLVKVRAYSASGGELVAETWLDTNYGERFSLVSLPAGAYKLTAVPLQSGFARQWYPGRSEAASAEPVTVQVGAVTAGAAMTLVSGGARLSGRIACSNGGIPWAGTVNLYDWYSGGLAAGEPFYTGGSYGLEGIPDGSYKLKVSVNGHDFWYRGAGESGPASSVAVSGGQNLAGLDLTVPCQPDGTLDPSGRPTIGDALRALRIVVGVVPCTDEIMAHYDIAPVIDGVSHPDGALDVGDVIVILRKAVGLQ